MSLKPAVSEKDHIQGNKSAAIELVEYGDYQCPHCGRAYPIVKEIQKAFGTNLKFIYRNFPLQEIHPNAVDAAIASEAAGLQKKFWQMHDALFENQRDLSPENIMLMAQDLALDTDKFSEDMGNQDIIDKVEADFESGVRSGVNGTPGFFVNGVKYNDSYDIETFSAYLKSLL